MRKPKDTDRIKKTPLPCIYCKHCSAIYRNVTNDSYMCFCELYSSPMREFECFEKDPLINIE